MIFIPAAGEGRRFREAGYHTSKHDIPLLGRTMVELVADNVRPLDPDGDVYVLTQEWVGKTKGAVDTILKGFSAARRMTGEKCDDKLLVVANCDQLIALPDDLGTWGNGLVFTFQSRNQAHSYVTTAHDGEILSIVEKPEVPPTDKAVSGVYAFPVASPFLDACQHVRATRDDGELFVSSALQVMLDWGFKLYAVDVPTAILGTPEDFQRFQTAMRFAPSCSC